MALIMEGKPAAAAIRISINGNQELAKQLRPGMSVIVRVDTRSKPMD